MAWIDKLNGRYYLETSNSKISIVNSLKERIDRANKNKSWISFGDIDYNMQVDDYRMIIKRNSNYASLFRGNGVIMIHFGQPNNQLTQINAEIKPRKVGLWITIGFLILFSTFVLFGPGTDDYSVLLIVWIGAMTIAYLNIVFFRYRLKEYLKEVLAGIGINDELQKR